MLQNGEKLFFQKLNPHNNKQFWKATKYLAAQAIPTLSHNNVTTSTVKYRANILNNTYHTGSHRLP